MNTYIKLFFGTGIPFGLITALIDGPLTGLIFGLIFGGLMALILGTTNLLSERKINAQEGQSSTGVHHTRTMTLNLPYEEAFRLCLQSVGHLHEAKIVNEDRHTGKIKAASGMTWKTWGDTITFQLQTVNKETTTVEFSSKPKVPGTLVDYGKNFQNVQTIEEVLAEYAVE